MDKKFFDDFANKFAENLPPGLRDFKQDLEKASKAALISVFSKLDLVTREELDVQAKILERAREKLVALEVQLEALQSAQKPTKKPSPTAKKSGGSKKPKTSPKTGAHPKK